MQMSESTLHSLGLADGGGDARAKAPLATIFLIRVRRLGYFRCFLLGIDTKKMRDVKHSPYFTTLSYKPVFFKRRSSIQVVVASAYNPVTNQNGFRIRTVLC